MEGTMNSPKLPFGPGLWLISWCLFATAQKEALPLPQLDSKKPDALVSLLARTPRTTPHVSLHPPKPPTTHHHHHHPTSTRGGKPTTPPHPTTTRHHRTQTPSPHNTTALHPTTRGGKPSHPTTTHHHRTQTASPRNTTALHPTTPTKAHSPSPTHEGNQTGSPHHTTSPSSPQPPTAFPPPTQLPVVPLGNYTVHNGSAVCLRAEMGLALRVLYQGQAKQQLWGAFPVLPDRTQVSGTCSNETASLHLRFPEGHLLFVFRKEESGNTSYLSHLQASLKYHFPQAAESSFSAENASLREFVTHLGKSYQCRARTVVLADDFHLEAVRERIQAFQLEEGAFGEAEVCPEQRRSILLPIAVGVVLGLLIVIVLLAFAVGRWRTHVGYQPL